VSTNPNELVSSLSEEESRITIRTPLLIEDMLIVDYALDPKRVPSLEINAIKKGD